MKLHIAKDEAYPVYSTFEPDTSFLVGGRVVDWPEDLSYDDYMHTLYLYDLWQKHLEELYNKAPPAEWETTTSWAKT